MPIILLVAFGLIVGSFLNVLIWRYDPNQSVFTPAAIGGRSHCPHCKKRLKWFELIPIFSFLMQRGRCQSCNRSLSFQYPIVELLTGAIFVAVPLFFSSFYRLSNLAPGEQYGLYLLIAIGVLAFLALLLIAAIDLKHYIIPDELNIILGVLGLLFVLVVDSNRTAVLNFDGSFLKHYALLFSPWPGLALNHFLGALIGGFFFGFISIVSDGRAMGFGDAKLAFVSGLLLGWPDIGLAIILAFFIGGAFGVISLITRQKSMKSLLPFAPFFVLGIALTVFFGADIISFYFRLFQIG